MHKRTQNKINYEMLVMKMAGTVSACSKRVWKSVVNTVVVEVWWIEVRIPNTQARCLYSGAVSRESIFEARHSH